MGFYPAAHSLEFRTDMQHKTDDLNSAASSPKLSASRMKQAIHKATDHTIAEIKALRSVTRLLLQEIVRGLHSEDARHSVQISNNSFADFLSVSVKMVSRMKTELEKAGLITCNQENSRAKDMQASEIWLTERALVLLGLSTASNAQH